MSYKEKDIIAENNGFAVVQFGNTFHILANGLVGAIDFEGYYDDSIAVARMEYLATKFTGREMYDKMRNKVVA